MPFHLVDAHGTRLAGLPAGGALVVGRGAECSLVLADPTVSRRHAEVLAAADHLLVHDLGSRNGTFRNGVKVDRARLRAGDVVAFGVVPLRVEHEAGEAPPPRAGDASDVGRMSAGDAAPVADGASVGADASPAATREDSRDGPRDASPAASHAASHAASPAASRAASPAASPDARATPANEGPAPVSAAPPAPATRASSADADGEPPILAERETASPHELTARRLAQLIEATKALGGAADVAAVYERIVGAALRTLDADRAAILSAGEDGAPLAALAARDRWGADLIAAGAPPVPRTITRIALQRRAALLTVDASADPRFVGHSVLRQRVRSAMCVPLLAADGIALGALYVDSADPQRQFAEADLDFLTAFGSLAAASLENARLAERLRREAVARENFARYFSAPVAERIARSSEPARLGGERRTVSVLFADLRGFTGLASGLSPDELASTLSEFLSAMVECVFRHQGTLDKFIGDCVMAQWGAPETEPDDADRALAAAIDMLGAVEALNARRVAAGRPALAIGVGLTHGEVFAGNIGSERRLEFTVIGDVVNQASRLCDIAGAGEILLSDALRQALRGAAPRMRVAVQTAAPTRDGEPGPPVHVVSRAG